MKAGANREKGKRLWNESIRHKRKWNKRAEDEHSQGKYELTKLGGKASKAEEARER
jgi:hypothetical protein